MCLKVPLPPLLFVLLADLVIRMTLRHIRPTERPKLGQGLSNQAQTQHRIYFCAHSVHYNLSSMYLFCQALHVDVCRWLLVVLLWQTMVDYWYNEQDLYISSSII